MMLITWSCPACQSQIRHSSGEDQPRLGKVYRCHVCRLELIFDRERQQLTVVPMRPDDLPEKQRTTAG